MPKPDLRKIAANIDEALEGFDRDALVQMLTWVFKEYVVEGPPPQLLNQADVLEEAKDLNFAQLITLLQSRLDLAELSLFSVDDDRVSVRIGGVKTPLTGDVPSQWVDTRDSAPTPAPEPHSEAPPSRLSQPQEPNEIVVPPRPARGLSLSSRARETLNAGAPLPAQPQVTSRPASGGQTEGEEKPPDAPKPSEGGENGDGATRFSLLELD